MDNIELLSKLTLLNKAISRKLELVPLNKKQELLESTIEVLSLLNNKLDEILEGMK